MRELGMLITSSSRERLKIVWCEGTRLYRAYEIDRESVSVIADEIRRCLGDLGPVINYLVSVGARHPDSVW
jgi:hypothetical protein